jgi:uncharacterized protein involved in exopolysaccharide biosynthesis
MVNENAAGTHNAPISDLIKLVFSRKKFILGFCLVGFVASIIFSGPAFMEPVYKSEVILYPPNTNSNKILIEKDPRFGSDDDVDQQIQILKSGLVRDSLIRKYDLMKHYKIDTASAFKVYSLGKEYESNVRVERTRYNSVSVTVYDTDPLLAATMANDIVKISDRVKSEVLKQNLRGAFHSLEKEYTSAMNDADALAGKVSALMGKSFVSSITLENKFTPNQLKEQIDLQQAMVEARKSNRNDLLGLLYDYQGKLQRLMELRWSYDQAAGYINLEVPSSYVISPAEVNYKKDSPNRTMLVLLTTLCSFLVAVAAVVLKEKYQKIKMN